MKEYDIELGYNDMEEAKLFVEDAIANGNGVKSFDELKPYWRKLCEFFKQYPDLFIDYISPPDCKIKLHFYQRVWLRILFRYKKVFITATRGTAKSFTEILALYLRCIMFPGVKLFISAPGKEQASNIAKANIEDIWNFFPILKGEVKHASFQKDYTRLVFHNNARLDVVQVAQSSRGGRRNGGAVEEIVDESMKRDTLNEVVIPMMANDRIAMCRGKDPNEMHKSQYYITTAGTRQSFAFEKMMEVLMEMGIGKSAFNLGSGFELPCMHEQLDEEFINDLRDQPTYNPLSFAREYDSIWTGSSEDSLVSLEDLRECRTITRAEHKAMDKDADYVLAYDVARAEGSGNADCALVVIKIIPRGDGTYQKHLVNIYTFKGTHFKEQALFLKKKVNDFRARVLVIDVNGLGKGLVDMLVLEIDENPPYEVINDDTYNKYKTENSVPLIFGVSSNTKETKASQIHNVFMNMISNHKVKMLVTESKAKAERKSKKNEDSEDVANELLPFIMTDLLQDEIMNLEYKSEGSSDTKIKQVSKAINKDKFSAFEYGLFWIYLLEKKNAIKKRESADAWKFMAIRKAKSVF